jgi:hypothetical protein
MNFHSNNAPPSAHLRLRGFDTLPPQTASIFPDANFPGSRDANWRTWLEAIDVFLAFPLPGLAPPGNLAVPSVSTTPLFGHQQIGKAPFEHWTATPKSRQTFCGADQKPESTRPSFRQSGTLAILIPKAIDPPRGPVPHHYRPYPYFGPIRSASIPLDPRDPGQPQARTLTLAPKIHCDGDVVALAIFGSS